MDENVDLAALRAATEDDVARARVGSYVEAALKLVPDEQLLEFYNRMLDVLTGERES